MAMPKYVFNQHSFLRANILCSRLTGRKLNTIEFGCRSISEITCHTPRTRVLGNKAFPNWNMSTTLVRRSMSAGGPGDKPVEKGSSQIKGLGSLSEKPQQDSEPEPPKAISRKEKLKQAIKDYGGTVIVFHVSISLLSLGFCYLLVSSGLDLASMLKAIGIGENILQNRVTQGASTFVVAYAVHKIFAPLRITITLTATPLIVRRLRNMGFLKKPNP